jgi:serine protease AprX
MLPTCVVSSILLFLLSVNTVFGAGSSSPLIVRKKGNQYRLQTNTIGSFHLTRSRVRNARSVQIPNSNLNLLLWDEVQAENQAIAFSAIRMQDRLIMPVKKVDNRIMLHSPFDPLEHGMQASELLNDEDLNEIGVYIVQFFTQPLAEYRSQINELGGTIYRYLPHNSYIVEMSGEVRSKVVNLPYVRWVGPYQAEYKLETPIAEMFSEDAQRREFKCYNIQVLQTGLVQQRAVARRILQLGGRLIRLTPQGFILNASLNSNQLHQIAQMKEVLFIDECTPKSSDMTPVRGTGGIATLEPILGMTGSGISGEVLDSNVRETHVDFQSLPILFHGAHSGDASHGTSTYGIVFGNGTANPLARGMLPDGQGIFADYNLITNRYKHTEELLQAPYYALFQSNSWGNTQTTAYTTISAELDDIAFRNDIVIVQSQSNTGNRTSRPQAWAKNVVSVGGIRHYGTNMVEDDCWCRGASIGPADDGRIKPDLAHYYDQILTTSSTGDTAYTPSFGGTSGATPIVAGHFGLFFEMWHKGLFNNPTGSTAFDSRPHASTSKAMLINTAQQWEFNGLEADLGRFKQGWGCPNLEGLYNLRDSFFIVDQTQTLRHLETNVYSVEATDSQTPLRFTLVYPDPSGNTASSIHRINDLTLKLTSPSGTVYWGNYGLLSGMWSEPDGEPDSLNTVENVFIKEPEIGAWTIEIIANEINEDGYLATSEMDAVYSLVVSGVNGGSQQW